MNPSWDKLLLLYLSNTVIAGKDRQLAFFLHLESEFARLLLPYLEDAGLVVDRFVGQDHLAGDLERGACSSDADADPMPAADNKAAAFEKGDLEG